MSIKESLKKNKGIVTAYQKFVRGSNRFCGRFFPISFSKKIYQEIFGRPLDLNNPVTMNEKLMYNKFYLYWKNPLVAKCADKLAVRDFIKENGCPELLNPLLGQWERAEDIDWESLPDKFALKCNHGSGYNIICKDKRTFDKQNAQKTLNKWLRETYGYEFAEQGIYSGIKRMIIAEQFIETPDDLPPADYKFFCSYGKVKLLFVACDRYNNNTKFDYYTPDWKWIPVKNDHPNNGPIEKPDNLDQMIRYAEVLSSRFPLVRVDFYDVAGKIIFGEMTFTHFGCIHPFDPDEYDYTFGALFEVGKDQTIREK